VSNLHLKNAVAQICLVSCNRTAVGNATVMSCDVSDLLLKHATAATRMRMFFSFLIYFNLCLDFEQKDDKCCFN